MALAASCSPILLTPCIIPADKPFPRFLAAASAVIVAVKLLDVRHDRQRGAEPDWRAFLAFLTNPFVHVRRRLPSEPRPSRRADLAQFAAYAKTTAESYQLRAGDGGARELKLSVTSFNERTAAGNPLSIHRMVEHTDPEALMLLEARRSGAAYAWQYAFARMQSLELTASYRGARVWEAPALKGVEVYGRADQAYAAFLPKSAS